MGHLILLSCEHAGNILPPGYRGLFSDSGKELESHRGIDIGASELAERFSLEWNAPLFQQPISRLLIDCNRSLYSPSLLSGYSKILPKERKNELVETIWQPYRQRIMDYVETSIHQGFLVIHLSLHTFTPVLDGNVRTTDIGLLHDPQRPGERELCLLWQKILQQNLPDCATHKNKPYRGQTDGLTTSLRCYFPPDSYLGIEVEVNQRFTEYPCEWNQLCRSLARSLPLFQFSAQIRGCI